MVNKLMEKIEVYNAEKVDGVWEQQLRIHYNCMGEITIPKLLPLPIPDVSVNTRKGVTVVTPLVKSQYKKRVVSQHFKCYKTTRLGTAEGIRTPDLLVRSQSLYPAELQPHTVQWINSR